jgi:TonB-linked SusC/RagA family outer membrane protein
MKRTLLLLFYLFSVSLAFAQNITITGKVTDATNGEGLPGTTVAVKGTTTGSFTDVNGVYTVSAPADGTLIFSFLGYVQQEIAVGNRTTINVQLAPDAKALQEVVVTGYGTQEKRDVTGSIVSVKSDEIVRQSSQNPVSSLQGKVAGVQITNPGQPGASPQVRIRGAGSAQGGVEPLYVVDGTFVTDLSFLNPADIESIEILKDASSASIYGLRAANGVVLVTTKRGKAGQTRINYNGFVGAQRVTNKLEMTNARDFTTLVNEKNNTNRTVTDAEGTDWYDQILRTAMIHNHQVTASGGSDKVTYSVSGGYLNQEGIINRNDYERITARLQTDITLSDRIKVGYNAIFSNYNSNDIPGDMFYQAFVAPPVLQVRKANGRYGDPADVGLGNFANPQASLDWFNRKSNGQRVTSNVFGEWNFLKTFTFRSSFGLNYGVNEYRDYLSKDSLTTIQVARRSRLEKSRERITSLLWENTLTYQKTFGDHEVTALLGTSSQEDRDEKVVASVNDVAFESEANLYLGLGDPETYNITNTGNRSTLISYFGRLNYSFLNRYLLTTTLRYDGSSKFPKGDRWDVFPSIGLGWILTEESFMKNQNLLNHLKLRASWGKLGNNNIPANIFTETVNRIAQYTAIIGNIPYVGANRAMIVPPTLLWEVVEETDLGAEFGFLNNRLSIEADWYNKVTQDAIFEVPILGSGGYRSPNIKGNFATFRNRGFEFAARWNDELNADFRYNIGFNFATNENQVTGLGGGRASLLAGGLPVGGFMTTISRVGDPLGSFYGYQVDGIFQTPQEVTDSAQPNAKPGDFRYKDLNNDKVIDARDKVVLGNPNPGFIYGINTGFAFKNFDLQLDIQGVADVDIYNGNRNVRYGNENYDQDFFENRWHGPGTSNEYPSANLAGSNLEPNSFYVEKGDYIRIRNLQAGYNLPAELTTKWKMQGFRVFVNAQNLVTLFKYHGFSPEVVSPTENAAINAGIDRNVYPLSATYNVGVNVTF